MGTRVPTIYVLSKNKKNIKDFLLKFFIFYNFKNLCILHGQVFVMNEKNALFMKCYLFSCCVLVVYHDLLPTVKHPCQP